MTLFTILFWIAWAIVAWTAGWLLLATVRRMEDLEGPASEESAGAAVLWAFVWLWWPLTLFRRKS